jgi:predicted metal-dependent phosphotriesterase family hydrolase
MTTFIPLLRQAGLSEDAITQIMVDNPRRALALPRRAG